jgi:hypothetical protein
MMVLDCPACLDQDGTVRCGLPAEVRYRFIMRSSDGPLESAMIRGPAGHRFSGPIGPLTWDSKNGHDPGTAAAASTARQESLRRTHDGRDSGGGSALPELPAEPGPAVRRPNCAPACYLGRPARQWITAMRRSRAAPSHPAHAVTGGGEGTPPPGGGLVAGAGPGPARVVPATVSQPRG